MSAIQNPPPQRLLIRGVNWLGDAVMTTPALLRLRESLPRTHIALLTPEKLADLWTHHPAVNEVIAFSRENIWQVSRRLRTGNFDTALALPNSTRSALELWLAGIPRRIGYGERGRSCLLNEIISRPSMQMGMHKRSPAEVAQRIAHPEPEPLIPSSAHHLHHYLHLAAALGASPTPLPPLIQVTESEVKAVARRFGLATSGPVLGLNAGAEYGPAKRWPRERFVAVAIEIHKKTRCQWLVFGGQGDAELAAGVTGEIQRTTGTEAALNLAGQTSLRELCIALSGCRVLLTNDTGPMHLAAAVGTPVIVPFGSTSPELTGPGLPGDSRHHLLKSTAPCSPCFLRECPIDFRCMKGISVDQVVKAMLQALAR
jgi:heptosyltransferase-2